LTFSYRLGKQAYFAMKFANVTAIVHRYAYIQFILNIV